MLGKVIFVHLSKLKVMKVIEIKNKMYARKAYQLNTDEQYYLDFKPEIEVLPAIYYDSENPGKFYFSKKHEPNTPGWKDGGYECYDINGAFRAFHLDALIVHPRVFKKKHRIKASDVKVTNTDNAPKRGRGRPKLDPSLLKTKVEYVSTGRGRGRPKKNPDEIKPKVPYVKTGKPRGRPAKVK